MRVKVCLLIIISICIGSMNHLLAQGSFSKTATQKKNLIKLNILSPFMGTVSLQYESIINEESSFQLGVYYFSGLVFTNDVYQRGICITPEYRLYLNTTAPEGIYLQPYFRVGRFWGEGPQRKNPDYTFSGVAGGIVFGKQWIYKNKISADAYIGPVYSHLFFDSGAADKKSFYPLGNGYWLRAGCSIGFLF